jgi:hypothetical protein
MPLQRKSQRLNNGFHQRSINLQRGATNCPGGFPGG